MKKLRREQSVAALIALAACTALAASGGSAFGQIMDNVPTPSQAANGANGNPPSNGQNGTPVNADAADSEQTTIEASGTGGAAGRCETPASPPAFPPGR